MRTYSHYSLVYFVRNMHDAITTLFFLCGTPHNNSCHIVMCYSNIVLEKSGHETDINMNALSCAITILGYLIQIESNLPFPNFHIIIYRTGDDSFRHTWIPFIAPKGTTPNTVLMGCEQNISTVYIYNHLL